MDVVFVYTGWAGDDQRKGRSVAGGVGAGRGRDGGG